MNGDLTSYPMYKDSGSAWLGEIPVHWEVRSLGSLIAPINFRNQPNLPLLSVVREKGVILRSTMSDDENHNYIPDDLSNYKVVQPGNLVINKMKAWQGSMGISQYQGIVSPAYFVFSHRFENSNFLHKLLRSRIYVDFFAQASDGVRVGQWDLSIDRMKRIPILVPPTAEQFAIVRFLNHIDEQINRLIRIYQKLVGISKSANERRTSLLFEYRTRMTADVVTGKLDVRAATTILPDEDDTPGSDADVLAEDEPNVDAVEIADEM